MKNHTLIASLGAASLAAAASASFTPHQQFANWYNAVNTAIGTTGGYYDPGTFANWTGTSSTTGTAGYGWEAFTVSVTNGTVAEVSGNLVFTSISSSSVMGVTFTFDRSTAVAPTASEGVYGFGLNISILPSGFDFIGIDANGASVANGPYANGFVGIVGSVTTPPAPTNPPLLNIVFDFQGGSTVTVTGTNYYMVPAPGAVALLGVAGIVGSRRRRA
jgi:hypothetical protein